MSDNEDKEYTAEQKAEHAKRWTKRKAKELQRSTGMKYTEALRQVKRQEEESGG
jgi:hypothetical protein